jgi:hypothetical protein
MSLSRGAVTWDDDSTPRVGRMRETPAPIYMSTPYEEQGAWGGRDASPGGRDGGAFRPERPEYEDATDARIAHLKELLESERRITRVLSHYSKIKLDGVNVDEPDVDLEVRDMEIDSSMPVLETMEMGGGNGRRFNTDKKGQDLGDQGGPESEGNGSQGGATGMARRMK